jgi:hypothetical protein
VTSKGLYSTPLATASGKLMVVNLTSLGSVGLGFDMARVRSGGRTGLSFFEVRGLRRRSFARSSFLGLSAAVMLSSSVLYCCELGMHCSIRRYVVCSALVRVFGSLISLLASQVNFMVFVFKSGLSSDGLSDNRWMAESMTKRKKKVKSHVEFNKVGSYGGTVAMCR